MHKSTWLGSFLALSLAAFLALGGVSQAQTQGGGRQGAAPGGGPGPGWGAGNPNCPYYSGSQAGPRYGGGTAQNRQRKRQRLNNYQTVPPSNPQTQPPAPQSGN